MKGNALYARFLLSVLGFLVPCFGLWVALGSLIATPLVGLANTVLTAWMPEIVYAVALQGPEALLMTRLGVLDNTLVPASDVGERLAFLLDTRLYTYAVPFYSALVLATPGPNRLSNYCWGLIVLFFSCQVGLLSAALKELMVALGTVFFEQSVFLPPAELIGLAYQLFVLLAPTLVPVLVWAWQSRESGLLGQASPGL